jgi:putative ATPase
MKQLDYGAGYRYPHDFENQFTQENYLPEKISEHKYYTPGNNKRENEINQKLKNWWPNKY